MLLFINRLLWMIATIFLVGIGIYFMINLKFVQFRFKEMFYNLFKKPTKGISSFESLMLVLGGRIGVGSIAGVSLAIYLGGMGSIFWMWVIAFISASTSFCETVLGVKFKEKDDDVYKGGPSYYIKNGLNNKVLGGIYAILILVSYIGGFLGIQSNTICKSLNEMVNINPYIVGIVICLITSLIIHKGITKIVKVTSKIVPFMTLFYVLIAIYILILNINLIPGILVGIVKSAFNFKSFFTGFLATLIIGVQRGIFSSEAGLGTGAIAASTIDTNSPSSQGFVQMLGIYITTMFICTATAIVVLTSNYDILNISDVNGIEITQYAFSYHLGSIGKIVTFISIVLFSFSTILSGYYNGESCLKYFFKKVKKSYLSILKICTLLVLFIGSIISSNFLWDLVDVMVAILAIINCYAIYKLKDLVKEELFNYKRDKV